MDNWCGTTDIRSLLLGGIFILLAPLIALGFAGYFIYCKLTGKVFLEIEKRELGEARRQECKDRKMKNRQEYHNA